jgi:signal recognition particle subunit SEC65
MKDYGRYVVWLDYFNSELKRADGRRVPLSTATRSPTLEELEDACRRLDLQPTSQRASFPAAASRASGYVSIKKTKPKQGLVLKIAKELSVVRGQAAKKQGHQQPGQKK